MRTRFVIVALSAIFVTLISASCASHPKSASPGPTASTPAPVPAPAPAPAPIASSDSTAPQAAHPSAVPSPVASPAPTTVANRIGARFLQLHILPAGEDPAIPDRKQVFELSPTPQVDDDEMLVTEDEIQYKKILSLENVSAPHSDRFFVWSEKALGSSIVDAYYERRVQDIGNRSLGQPDRHPVSFDEETRRWFVPFSKIFEGQIGDIEPSEEQLINLDLLLADSTRVQVKVRFRGLGPVPQAYQWPCGPIPVPLQYYIDGYHQGFVIFFETIGNTTGRPMNAWVRARETLSYSVTSMLVRPPIPIMFGSPVLLPQPPNEMSTVRLALSSVTIERPNLAPELRSISWNQWTSVRLAPGEKVVLRWRVSPSPGTASCDRIDTTYRVLWDIAGAHMVGFGLRDLRLASPLVPEGIATAENPAWSPAPDLPSQITVGEVAGLPNPLPAGTPFTDNQVLWRCQGALQ